MLNLSEVDRYEKNGQDSYLCLHLCGGIQITAFAGFTWRVESADSSYVGTTNVTVTNTSGKKETEDAPIVKRGTVVTFTEAAASATYTVRAYDGMGNPIRDFSASLGTVKKGGTLQYTLDWNAREVGRKVLLHRTGRCL